MKNSVLRQFHVSLLIPQRFKRVSFIFQQYAISLTRFTNHIAIKTVKNSETIKLNEINDDKLSNIKHHQKGKESVKLLFFGYH